MYALAQPNGWVTRCYKNLLHCLVYVLIYNILAPASSRPLIPSLSQYCCGLSVCLLACVTASPQSCSVLGWGVVAAFFKSNTILVSIWETQRYILQSAHVILSQIHTGLFKRNLHCWSSWVMWEMLLSPNELWLIWPLSKAGPPVPKLVRLHIYVCVGFPFHLTELLVEQNQCRQEDISQ